MLIQISDGGFYIMAVGKHVKLDWNPAFTLFFSPFLSHKNNKSIWVWGIDQVLRSIGLYNN